MSGEKVYRDSGWFLAVGFAILVTACSAPTSPSINQLSAIESFGGSVQPIQGTAIPDYSGIWRGESLLTDCRSALPAACKDAPHREAVRLQITQTGSSLSGTLDGLSQLMPFVGVVTRELGIAGGDATAFNVRLTRLDESFIGFLVRDTYQGVQLYMSKKYEIVTPLRREP